VFISQYFPIKDLVCKAKTLSGKAKDEAKHMIILQAKAKTFFSRLRPHNYFVSKWNSYCYKAKFALQ